MGMYEWVGRVLVVVVHPCFEDRGGNQGNGDQFLVCALGAHDETVAAVPTPTDGRVRRRSGLGWPRLRGRGGGGRDGVGRRARDCRGNRGGMADTHFEDVVVVIVVLL